MLETENLGQNRNDCSRKPFPFSITNFQKMKYLTLATLTLGLLLLFGCNQAGNKANAETEEDTAQIQKLIRDVLAWSDSKNTIDLLPLTFDSKDSSCNGFDLDKLKTNLDQLRSTAYFAEEFVQNYSQIIQTLDKKTKNNEFGKWYPGEMPPFTFASDVNPWCECQDNMDWNVVEVKSTSLTADKGELNWFWGSPSNGADKSAAEFKSPFSVVKEDGKWKISYMHGFDFKESTK